MTATPMSLAAALQVLAGQRRDQIVVTTMGAAREWSRLADHPLDLHYVPSAMGHAPSLGLGLALAQPRREVIVLNGDGCMLMGLGVLVTIAASGASNLTLVVVDNGCYEVTGGQATAARSGGLADRRFSYAALATAAGWPTARQYDRLEDWQADAAAVLAEPGPRCIQLTVAQVGPDFQLPTLPPITDRLRAFRQAVQNT
jgi:thiamine pyrophosphate-dependent acetolactate synthase large subunit-like protein